MAVETGLTELLIIGKGVGSGQSMPSSLAAAVYESIVAAVYLDGGFEAAKGYILRTMGPKIDPIASSTHQNNYKAILQQHAQKIMNATPIYELLDEMMDFGYPQTTESKILQECVQACLLVRCDADGRTCAQVHHAGVVQAGGAGTATDRSDERGIMAVRGHSIPEERGVP